ncbi:MAG: TetR/AcrR family transcriptional regulator [Burkholderiaceae bacterium]|nr:MAG: TetR/AcrR family transcriptional regulator [Burkholderiaceae bacterium]TAM00720.1 MAG: TetR/AcrR family transcriptional regulator [Pusillimonas sp.]
MKPSTARQRGARAKGRPDTADGVGREALLQAAIDELKHTTPEAVTLAGVAARAGVHPALIRYYFGNKGGLLQSVAQVLVEQGQEAARSKIESDAPIAEKLADRLRSMIELIQANPQFHRLVLDQVYGHTGSHSEDQPLSRITSRGLRMIIAMLHDSTGARVRPVDPRFLHMALIGLTEFFVPAKPLLQELFGADADIEDLKTRYIDFLGDLLLNGLLEPQANTTPPPPPRITPH